MIDKPVQCLDPATLIMGPFFPGAPRTRGRPPSHSYSYLESLVYLGSLLSWGPALRGIWVHHSSNVNALPNPFSGLTNVRLYCQPPPLPATPHVPRRYV